MIKKIVGKIVDRIARQAEGPNRGPKPGSILAEVAENRADRLKRR